MLKPHQVKGFDVLAAVGGRSGKRETVSNNRLTNMPKARSAEKNRQATCSFADRVAAAVIAKCRELRLPFADKDARPNQQTVVSGILALDYTNEKEPKCLEVISLGVGTKFMRSDEVMADKNKGLFVHDSHAEVLARRAFLRILLHDMHSMCQNFDKHSGRILKRLPPNRFCIKDNVLLHFYTSSSPCGNSTVRRWGTSPKESTWPGYSDKEKSLLWPSIVHEEIDIAQRQHGQIIACVKRDVDTKEIDKEDKTNSQELSKNTLKEPYFAIGTAPIGNNCGCILSCSDKIALWNTVGLQGAILNNVLDPVFLTTITVGRKFIRKHLHRALCCRLQELPAEYDENSFLQQVDFPKLNHPTILCTSVKLNNGAIEETTKASFDEVQCFSWCTLDGNIAEEVDGLSGRALESKTEEISQISGHKLFESFQTLWQSIQNVEKPGSNSSSRITSIEKAKDLTIYSKAYRLRKNQALKILISQKPPYNVKRRKRNRRQRENTEGQGGTHMR